MTATVHDADTRRRISGGGLRTWFNIASDWGLTDRQAACLLGAPTSTYRRWKTKPEATLDIGQIERLSLLLGIYKALQILLPRVDAADSWIHRANTSPLFGGQSPLERMLAGLTEDIALVRRHLDAERGGWA
ncbi:MbcA/ParS/Xre antitoxin family protein [Salinisphaera japonica]|uniref:Uncharacterized protein n=1 Tax=Salinisphaera japonica YTM-1 TaxID=1209778 RepID=A0A423PNB8_9GAMM|nr:MbcA/ParS/Xre antitoxin family protein [Salinisphaera japonica]ROO27080.1 hypothetical protein SAJA_10055 [Salinisphaera japonica YTM-1]